MSCPKLKNNWTGYNSETTKIFCDHRGFRGRPALKTPISRNRRGLNIWSVERNVDSSSSMPPPPSPNSRGAIIFPVLFDRHVFGLNQDFVKCMPWPKPKRRNRRMLLTSKLDSYLSPDIETCGRASDGFRIDNTRSWMKMDDEVDIIVKDAKRMSKTSTQRELANLHKICVPKTGFIQLTTCPTESEHILVSNGRNKLFTDAYKNEHERYHHSFVLALDRQPRPPKRYLVRDKTVIKMINERGAKFLPSDSRDITNTSIEKLWPPPSIQGLLEFEIPVVPTLSHKQTTFVEANTKGQYTNPLNRQKTWSIHSPSNNERPPTKLLLTSRSLHESRTTRPTT